MTYLTFFFSFVLAIDKAVTIKIRDGKEHLIQRTLDICSAYSKEVIGVVPSKSSQLGLCRSLSLLPALTLALLKSVSTLCLNYLFLALTYDNF
jgi:hypothetical protein